MWSALGVVANDWYEKQQDQEQQRSYDIGISMRRAVQLVKQQWENSKLFRVSDTVMMTEKQIISRLQGEGHIMNYPEQDPLKLCFLFRRHPLLRMQFASAVGKRMWTERISATSKAGPPAPLHCCIVELVMLHSLHSKTSPSDQCVFVCMEQGTNMEHSRTFGWSELEYHLLVILMRDKDGASIVRDEMMRHIHQNTGMHAWLFSDYAGLLCPEKNLYNSSTGQTIPPALGF